MIPQTPQNPFNSPLAEWYDVLQSHKDRKGQIEFLHNLFLSIPLGKESRILDLGCGTGFHAAELARLGWNIVGIDSSPFMIEKAQSVHSRADFFVSTIEEFSQKGFDCCYTMGEVINYLPSALELPLFFRKVHKSLTNEGVFYFQIWNPLSLEETPPLPLTREFETEEWKIFRPVIPHFDPSRQKLALHYKIKIIHKTDPSPYEFSVTHHLHLFTPEEIFEGLRSTGFIDLQMKPVINGETISGQLPRFLSFMGRKTSFL